MAKRTRKGAAAPKRRNPLDDHPLMRKGAAHGKTRKAERRAERVRRAREWPVQSVFERASWTGHSAAGAAS